MSKYISLWGLTARFLNCIPASKIARYNGIYRVQRLNITPRVCRHTYRSNQAKAEMNKKTLWYFMEHSDISVTMNMYIHIGFVNAEEKLKRMEKFRKVQSEV